MYICNIGVMAMPYTMKNSYGTGHTRSSQQVVHPKYQPRQLHINVFQRALVSQNPALLPSLTVHFSEKSAKIRTHVSQFDLMYHVYQEQSLGIDQECKGESNNHKINIDQLWLSPQPAAWWPQAISWTNDDQYIHNPCNTSYWSSFSSFIISPTGLWLWVKSPYQTQPLLHLKSCHSALLW